MNKAGRLTFVKSVLGAVPLHQLLVHAPPKKSLKQLERIERGFLWAGREEAKGGNCHVSWRRVCRPISLGGLGVHDLERTGLALRMRWLWFSRTDINRAWSGLDLQFSAEERALFFASTTMSLGNGATALFWEDRWIQGRSIRELAPLLYECIPKRRRRTRTVADGLQGHSWARDIHGTLGVHEIGQYLRIWMAIEHTTLGEEPDTLLWKWTASGTYTAKSCYFASFHGSTTSPTWRMIWKCWAPPRVKFFHWLADLDRCWTADRLARRGLPHHTTCPLCNQEPETMRHLIIGCPFARQVWHEIIAWLRLPCAAPSRDATLLDWWQGSRQHVPKPMRKGLSSMALLIPWMVWKQRNDCVFEGAQPSVTARICLIKDEARLWARAGALGLRILLPTTWDVH
jgi:hypothetical protein